MKLDWRETLLVIVAITGVIQATAGFVLGQAEPVLLGASTALAAVLFRTLRRERAPLKGPRSTGMYIGGIHVVPLAILGLGLILVATTDADAPTVKIYASLVMLVSLLYLGWMLVSGRRG